MSYRSSYTPWKSSLSSNYKTGSSSAYSSRDDVSSASRYSSLASPSSYRPSFSGGTYRLKRDTPLAPATTYVSRYSAGTSTGTSTVPKIETSGASDSLGSKTGQLKRYGSTSSNLGKYSREPSPAALEHTNRIKSRDPSPATRSLRGKSRDPSPALDTKCKIGYGSAANSYRMNVPKSTTPTAYGTRYGSSSTAARTSSASASSASISYLSASDFKARSLSKAREAATRKSNEKELEAQESEQKTKSGDKKTELASTEESTASTETEEEDEEEDEDDDGDVEEEKFITVSVCTRATSPTPPGAATTTTVHRTRRIEIAKTIEKTIQRSTKKKKMLEKEIQSDRLDDSTRYSRFGLSSRVSSSYSPHTERYSSSSLRYSHSPLSTTSKSSSLASSSESRKEELSNSSNSISSKSAKSPLASKSKLSPPKTVKINSRQSSVENLSAHKPPAAPKGESPTKSSSSSASLGTKLPNKDFRKSALNVGPTDRPRKSRTPSTGTDSDLNTVEALNGALQAIQRLERSPSAGSEVSNASNRSIRRTGTDSKLRPRCHNKSLANGAIMSPKSPLSRNNSNTNIKAKTSSSATSTTTTTASSSSGSSATQTTSSSSGTESCTESKKSNKKIIKKKTIKDVTNTTNATTSTNSTSSTTTTDTQSVKSSNENSFAQQPAVSNNKAKKSDSSTSRATTTNTKSPSDKDPLRRLKKLSSVSNFLAAQQQDSANSDEQIYLESSENSSGNDLHRSLSKKSISLTQANETKTTPSPPAKTKNSLSATKKSVTNSLEETNNNSNNTLSTTKSNKTTSSSKTKSKTKSKSNTNLKSSSSNTSTSYCPQDTNTVNESSRMPSELQTESLSPYTTTNPTTSSTSGTDQEESSWWQDTSRQIDTASALDFNLKDEMRFKIRHIDSGETAWWLRNDEDDTLADDDLKTLNQEEEEEEEEELEDDGVEDDDNDVEVPDQLKSLTSTPSKNAERLNDKNGWWLNETNDSQENEIQGSNETNYRKSRSSNELDHSTNGYCIEEAPVEAKPFPKSRLTPETDWWNDEENVEEENKFISNEIPSAVTENSSDKSGKNSSQTSDKSSKQNGSIQLKICRVESGEKPWWLQEEKEAEAPTETKAPESEITVEATIALPKKNRDKSDTSSSNSEAKNWWMSGPTKKLFNIQRAESGEKAWWQEETNETKTDNNKVYKRNDSQEQEWWLEDNQKQQTPPQHIQTPSQNGYYASPLNPTEDEPELQQYQHSNYNHNHLVDAQAELSNSFNFEYSERPPPLGQCASPVQQEELLPPPPSQHQPLRQQQCKSPYDNIPMTKVQTKVAASLSSPLQQPILETSTNFMASPIYQQQQQQQQQDVYQNQSPLLQQQQQPPPPLQYFPHQRQQQQIPIYLQQQAPPPTTPSSPYNNNELRSRNGQLFISRHQNIDELLGGSCRPISPLFYDNGSFQTMPPPPPPQRNIFVEEITPDQVRIHDSTAQMPIIQRMERDDWQRRDSLAAKPTTPPRFEQRMIDDAAIQVYKDGDYGSYLDLESSLAEQSEEIEGLNSSRKNSLVVRTQLSVRVHAIIEKLLSSEGSDLRRALFSLKQVFQEDKDLVHAFVALGGLNCLVRVGNGADQNYQNYILRALGQVMLYVDGMNGVMKHEPTMQWLYSLIASNYRSVVKTALKLLLVFVEYAESNCHVLVSAIHAVDKQQGTLPWSNIMRLLKDYDNADAELVIYAASLINKTLEGLNDQDSFYDESDLLEQQGMESVIQHYMSKPGTDMDLLNQLQLYEAVLKFEDGESDGTRLPDNTLRKTQRFRSSTDTAERRKSRRHSTGTSPGNINKVLPTHMRLTPTQPALDEDSSSSTNSAEFSGGVFAEKKPRDGAGVTPGLRRRRERAERHRSFLKEQQEVAAAVAANIFMNSADKREDMGQLVTAIPVTLKNGDSPPESLNIINENNCNYNNNNNNNHITNTTSNNNHHHHNNNNSLKHSYQISNNNNNNSINHSNNNNNANLNVIVNATANANATNNNNALITNNHHHNNNNIITNSNTTTHNNHINLLSPTKQLLGTNTISIINNSFDKSNTNKLQHHQHHHHQHQHHNHLNHVNAPAAALPAAEFYNKKNLFMERNATVINGLKKNIQRHNTSGTENNLEAGGGGIVVNGSNHHQNHCDNVVNYKKFENDANRLNTYYNQINNSTPKNQQQQPQTIQSPTISPMKHNISSLNSSPKKTLNSTTTSSTTTTITNPPTAAGFEYIPQTSTPNVTPVKTLIKQSSIMEDNMSTTCSTPSTPQRVMSPPVTYPVQNVYNNTIMTNTSVAPPPPPPPPPPPDLWGYANNNNMRIPPPPPPPPPYFYHNNNMSYNQNTTTNNIIPNSNQANNVVNTTTSTTNNNLNSNSDPNDLLQINESDNEDKKLLLQLKRDHTVKDLTQKLCNLPTSPTQDDKLQNRIVGDMSGLISKAKEGLAKSKSKGEMSRSSSVDQEIKQKPEPKKSENELQWEELVRNMSRPLNLCDLDFTDLNSEDEKDILAPRGFGRGIPPPPPPIGGVALPPPMMPTHLVCPPPMNHPMSMSNTSNGSTGGALIPPPMFSYSGYGNASLTNSVNSSMNGSINGDMSSMNTIKKNKKTVKLFWKEVREDLIPMTVGKTIWDELPPANVDTQKLEHLFESRAKDLMTKKQQEMNKSKEVIVLDHKRSNAINIAMTKLPPPRAIKAAILKMDATVVTREGIDKLLNMLPTDEEKGKIQEAQMANPELPLGSAEQFLLTLASISELAARLRLWAFRLDFDNSEKEIAEPLMDLKQGIEILKNNRTFKCILSTLLSVGIFLNGAPVKGFQIEYLAKVPEVKDTVHKHSLLHHLCHMVMESGTETTDLYSEIGPITRASKADFNDLAHNLAQLEHECKASWDRLKLIAKHDCPPQLKQKLVDFLADCAERIIILQIVHRRVMNRYRKFLLWLGVPQHSVADSRPNEFCRIVSEFALEYRTTRERVQQQIEKKANHRERNKTRGKLIVDIAKFKTKEDKQDAELKSLLGTPTADTPDGTLTWRRRRAENLRSPVLRQSEENFTDGDDEILESLVKTATKAPGTRTTPRERKRTRHADRKSLKRSRTREGFTVERVPSP